VNNVEPKKRVPVKRWIVLACIILGIYAAYFGPSILKPVSPTVILPAEPIWYGSPITNTMLATLLSDVILILLAIGAYRFYKSGKVAPGGILNAFETIVEYLWNTVVGAMGKWAMRTIPLLATIFLLIFVANMVKLVPGFESIGYLEKPHKTSFAYAPVELFTIGNLYFYAIDPATSEIYVVDDHHEETSEASSDEEHKLCEACQVVPFLRGSATDLNFTLGLAIIAVFMTQVYGVWALGPGYFSKFFQFRELTKGGAFGIINFAVGLLELILEFAKVLSFGFRLFGNIFAGALLLAIVGSLLPVIIPPGLYIFEIFFGIIQAYVFYLLATMFISMALVSHHGDEHADEHH
jgi:F-type H+-transporting ATPase subunit a